jgi:hypothetical protein
MQLKINGLGVSCTRDMKNYSQTINNKSLRLQAFIYGHNWTRTSDPHHVKVVL